jgi:hypothetical protein
MRRLFDILIRPRQVLLLLLLVTLLKGWLWSVVVPIWQASDEDRHYSYAQEVVRQRTLAVSNPQQMPEEQLLLWNLLLPRLIFVHREPVNLSPTVLAQIDTVMHRLDSPAAHTTLVPSDLMQGFIRQHPPLYYALQALVYRLWEEHSILVRIAWMRFLSVLMALGLVVCTYGAARTLWPERPWVPVAAATLVSFQPTVTLFTSVINNSALEMLCFAGLGWLAVVIARRGMNWRRGLALGVALAAGLLTRSSFLAAVPVALLLWVWDLLHARGRPHWGGWVLAAILPLALTSWWYAGFVTIGHEATTDLYGRSSTPPESVPLLGYLRTYPWLTQYIPRLREWWGLFGWRDTPYPEAFYVVLEILTLGSFLGWGWLGVRIWRKRHELATMPAGITGDGLALIIGIACTLSLIAFYTALDYRMATYGDGFKMQGRYFLAPVAAQMIALAVGWNQLSRRWGLVILCTAMIGLGTYTLFGLLVPRYYGEQVVVRYFQIGDYQHLVRDDVTRRDFPAGGEELSRLDVWLGPFEAKATNGADLTLYGKAEPVVQIPISTRQMIAPRVTILRFRTGAGGFQHYTAELRGTGVLVGLAKDGQMALKAYYRVPLEQIPERISIVQPPGRSVSFLWILTGSYLLCLGLLVAACWASAARLVGPVPLPCDLEAP